MNGMYATLITPYRGYRNIVILERWGNKYRVEVCGSGAVLELYDDEFILD